jgi:hypothetical protein
MPYLLVSCQTSILLFYLFRVNMNLHLGAFLRILELLYILAENDLLSCIFLEERFYSFPDK